MPGALHRAADAARRTQTGELETLNIGFVGALLDEALLNVFHRFRQTWPTTRLNLVDLPPRQLSEQLESRELHGVFLGVRPSRLPAATTSFKWRTEALVACLPLQHRFAQRQRTRLQDLAGENFVALSHAVAPDYRDLLDGLFHKRSIQASVVQETNTVPALLSMVVAGCGVAVLPVSATKIAEGKAATVAIAERDAKLNEVFLFQRPASAPLESFLKTLQNRN